MELAPIPQFFIAIPLLEMKQGLLYTLGLIVLNMVVFATSPAEAQRTGPQQLQPQTVPPGASQLQQQSLPSKLIPPRPFTVNKETMDQLVRTPPKLPAVLTAQEQQALRDIAKLVTAHDTTAAKNRWSTLITTLNQKNLPMDINELMQYVLRESYLQTNRDLQYYADKVKFYNDQKEQIRREIAKLRQQLQNVPSGGPPHPPGSVNPANIANAIRQWEEKLSSVGDDAQLANIDLQNKLQQQQQTLQTISNVSKMLNDTALAIIRKIG